MKPGKFAITAAVVSLLAACSDDASTSTQTGVDTELSLKTVSPYRAGANLSGLRVTGTGFNETMLFSLNSEELYLDNVDDTSAILFYRNLPDTGYQMLRAENTTAEDSLPVIYRDSIVTFAGNIISWQGALATAPLTPQLNWAYFNSTDNTAYIFNGTGWDILALSGVNGVDGENGVDGKDGLNGLNGISIIWKGVLEAAPAAPAINWAYYNSVNGISYIFNGIGWDVLAKDGIAGKDGINGISIVWLGAFPVAPAAPAINNAYYNTVEGVSYIFDGTVWSVLSKDGTNGVDGTNGTDGKDGTNGTDGKDGTNGIDGKDGTNGVDGKDGINGIDGISIVWKGELLEDPTNPQLNWAYYNTIKKASFIFDGTNWNILAKDGVNGKDGKDADGAGVDGISIIWMGASEVHPATPQLNWAYYNTSEGKSYIFNGTTWNIITQDGMDGKDGVDGISIVWLGELAAAPAAPSLNNAYYNSTDGISYIFNGTDWDILAKDGTNGTDGVDGQNGTDGKDGKDGINGVSLIWKGELAEAPANPALNWAYFNSTDERSYIYNGTGWDTFAKGGSGSGVDGKDGADGISIVWKGELAAAPGTPELNWAYHNTTDGNSYIWDGAKWNMLAKGGIAGINGTDGKDGTDGTNGTDGKDGTNGTNGKDGVDGVSIIWKGSFATAPANPEINWGYFNSEDYVSYIYSGSQWDTLAVSEKPVMYRIMDTIAPRGILVLEHNLNADDLAFTAQFRRKNSTVINDYKEYTPEKPFYQEGVTEELRADITYAEDHRPVLVDNHEILVPAYVDNYPNRNKYQIERFASSNGVRLDSIAITLPEGTRGMGSAAFAQHHNGNISIIYSSKPNSSADPQPFLYQLYDQSSSKWSTPITLDSEDGKWIFATNAITLPNGEVCLFYHHSIMNDGVVKRFSSEGVELSSDTLNTESFYKTSEIMFNLPTGNTLLVGGRHKGYREGNIYLINSEGVISRGPKMQSVSYAFQRADGSVVAVVSLTGSYNKLMSTRDGYNWVELSGTVGSMKRNFEMVELPDGKLLKLEQHGGDQNVTATMKIYSHDMRTLHSSYDEDYTGAYRPIVGQDGTLHLFGIDGSNFQDIQLYKRMKIGQNPNKKLHLYYTSTNSVSLYNYTDEELILTLAVNRGRSAQ